MTWNPFAKPVRPSQRATANVRSPSDELLIAEQAREIKALNAEIAKTALMLGTAQSARDVAERQFRVTEAELRAARAELAPLKAIRERQLQNLRDANARRKKPVVSSDGIPWAPNA